MALDLVEVRVLDLLRLQDLLLRQEPRLRQPSLMILMLSTLLILMILLTSYWPRTGSQRLHLQGLSASFPLQSPRLLLNQPSQPLPFLYAPRNPPPNHPREHPPWRLPLTSWAFSWQPLLALAYMDRP